MKAKKAKVGAPSKGDRARVHVYTLRLSERDKAILDAKRGHIPLGTYLRETALAS